MAKINPESNAEIFVEKQKQLLDALFSKLESIQNPPRDLDAELDKEIAHWHKVFVANAIASGQAIDDALNIADILIEHYYP